MRLTSLQLENIKSYAGPLTIDLTVGLNAVCGHNGSGKTTILEAIGFALFDYLPYKQAFFVREGMRGGTVRVRLLARDGREYEVVRRAGSPGAYYVADVETGTRMCERAAQVLEWIRTQALDIESETSLEALFEKAVGVPQGTMTADFLGQPTARKAVFDPLLRVEEYEKAWQTLREAGTNLIDRTRQVDIDMARLQASSDLIPEKRAGLDALRVRCRDGAGRLTALQQELDELRGRETVLASLKSHLLELTDGVRAAEYEANRLRDALQGERDRLTRAEEALTITTEAEPAYRETLDLQQQLSALSDQRRERDALTQQHAAAVARRNGVFGRIEQLDNQVNAAIEAGREAATLTERVTEQRVLETRRQAVEGGLVEARQLTVQFDRLQREHNKLGERCRQMEQNLEHCRKAAIEVEALPALEEKLNAVAADLAALAPLRAQQREVHAHGVALNERHAALLKDVAGQQQLQRQIIELEPLAQAHDGLIAHQRSMLDRQTTIRAQREYTVVAQQALAENHCPLLELRCPVVSADSTALNRLTAREPELAAEAETLVAELLLLDGDIARAAAAQKDQQRLALEAAPLQRAAQEVLAVEEELCQRRLRYRELGEQLEREPALRTLQQTLDAEVKQLRRLSEQASQAELLADQVRTDGEVLAAQQHELTELAAERVALTGLEEERQHIQGALDALADPQGRQQSLLALAGQQAALEQELAQQHQQLVTHDGEVKAVSAALADFSRVDDQEKAANTRIKALQTRYERYLQHSAEAATVDQRLGAVRDAEERSRVAGEQLTAARAQLEDVERGYDGEAHIALAKTCHTMELDLIRATTEQQRAESDLHILEGELAELVRQDERRRARQTERDELEETRRALDFVRTTIRAAGPAITEALLRNISGSANDIYAEIIDDHAVELRWDKNYEIVVQRGAEEREFAQLSGGEQMSAALAVRLALLKEMSAVDFAFFDEPTQNMDGERRGNLAAQIRAVRGFEQLIVISHDDTFEHHTDNLIRLYKVHEETRLDDR